MTATTEPRAPADAAAAPAAPDRAAGVELLGDVHGSGYKKGASLVRRADGQMVQLGPLMYGLLECADGQKTLSELAGRLSERLGRGVDEGHVHRLAEKLAAQGLLAGSEQHAPPRRNPLLALRWKVLVTNPKLTSRLTAPFTVLFRPFLVWPVVVAFVAVVWFVLFDKGLASATAQAFDSPGLILLVLALVIVSAAFHELGHAAACRYGGAAPAGMGMGIYLVWPAFYTDVTDSYRLPRRDRLRVDFGGLYFNAVVAVVTTGVWLVWHVDALLLVVALQFLMMIKNLSPVIRSDGYHILADATGIPDLYAHIVPTLRRLIPGHRSEPSALKGRARLLVTLWVLIVVPVLLSLMLGAVLLLPRMLASAWASGHVIAGDMPHEVEHAQIVDVLSSSLRLLALILPLLGSALITQRLARGVVGRAHAWSAGRPARGAALVVVAAAVAAAAGWAWWPAGQYQAVRADERGTLAGFRTLISSPESVARPAPAVSPPALAPGTHLAVSMIPVGGATKAHPALFVIKGDNGQPAVAILSSSTLDPAAAGSTPTSTGATTPSTTTTTTTTPATTSTTTRSAPSTAAPVSATAFPFKLPSGPGPGGTQALAVGTKDGGVTYDVAYALVTVSNGARVTNRNDAYALASCKACLTVAVSFQIVLIVGQSNVIMPINVAEALNDNCPACVTTAIADQIVVTLRSQPTPELMTRLNAALKELGALPQLGAGGTPVAVAAEVAAVQSQIETALTDSGQLAKPLAPTHPATTSTTPAAAPSPSNPTTTTGPTTMAATTTTSATSTTPTPTTTTPPTTTTTTTSESTTPTTTTTTTTTESTTPTTTAETTTTATTATTTTTTTPGG